MDTVGKLSLEGEGAFLLASRLSNIFREAGYGNQCHVDDAAETCNIRFDTAPHMETVLAIVHDLPERHCIIAAHPYAPPVVLLNPAVIRRKEPL